jgi:hypothetical protein
MWGVVTAESVFDHAEAHGINGGNTAFCIDKKGLPA